jgi:hypothetical protein
LKKEGLGCGGEGRRARELETVGYSAAHKEETKNEEGGRREENESQSRSRMKMLHLPWGFAAAGNTLHRFLQLFCSNLEHWFGR